ncbi:MAG: hydrogenase maturation nickel metallochaperone HypA [Candidatus Lambdaproteobacteria bacterium RIFOXYD1_FULL_56_27]|uniref:Hydrogenase maturation factor HypA n=1 Tax=Candidatus Lambdaproteobacteria bacterium RIFOXYD2_FULL_56_26 TaxID=1817773 RepID=A0A1F6GVF4_9PROT|nr:MAG: hydrogenase maturation nickel metallochaperone HypA [Candidatus Lambdaproteobacteria bacterium RIFOXYC1_FULL_56_13]OGH02062.1 MAG: hydrogenase maturation nickel metallochaperone HypA [Candidatus Lambdaproteobacteria bacterium RIFOXYD2_FULL_56_26]OGH07712.1 MAG: hydrogenase maturation nickel metallochaperone HypA [Candidatus Lambdaproteobacteria bacterium RIFOXYD1_FULL_56_27]
MHELSIIQGVLQDCCTRARQEGAAAITRIELVVGERSGVSVSSLEFAFEAARLGSLAQEASLVIEARPALARCLECQAPFAPQEGIFLECPQCGGPGELVAGRELLVSSMEIETNL